MRAHAAIPKASIRSVARATDQLSESRDTDRKAIRRALRKLEEEGRVFPKGEGRSRVYVLETQASSTAAVDPAFKDISL